MQEELIEIKYDVSGNSFQENYGPNKNFSNIINWAKTVKLLSSFL